MKSPFPGMDPYIEAAGLWGDFHDDLIAEIKRALAPLLPERYAVRTQERSYIVLAGEEGKEAHPFIPDAAVQVSGTSASGGRAGTTTAVAEPATTAGAVLSVRITSSSGIFCTGLK